MIFKKYNSIENSHQDDFLKAIREQGFGNQEYIVQEKVHGANLSFVTDGQQLLSAKRTEPILDGEDFFNSKIVSEKYKDKILALFLDLSNQFHAKTITVFGELFGGGYPHPDIPKTDHAKLVQRGIYYCPSNDFYAFDILINHDHYLDTQTANQLFDKHGFIYAETLFRGSLSDCLAYPNAFKTTIPGVFNLPELEGNICEGVVIRPLQPTFLRNGARVMIKNKNEKWAENNNYIDHTILKELLRIEGEALSEEANFLCEEVFKQITNNRLNNLISKIGEVDPSKDFGKVLGLYNKDVLTELLKRYPEKYNSLEKQEAKAVNKFLNKYAAALINDYFDK